MGHSRHHYCDPRCDGRNAPLPPNEPWLCSTCTVGAQCPEQATAHVHVQCTKKSLCGRMDGHTGPCIMNAKPQAVPSVQPNDALRQQQMAVLQRQEASLATQIKALEASLATQIKALEASLARQIKALEALLPTQIKALEASLATQI